MRSYVFALVIAVTAAITPSVCPAASASGAPAAQQLKVQFYAAVARKDDQDAVRLGAAYIAQVPGDDALRLDYAYALIRLGRSEEAVRELHALAASADPRIAAAASKQLAAQQSPAPAVPSDLQQAYDASARRDYAKAISLLQSYLATHPEDDAASLQLAYDLNSAGRNAESLAVFKRLRSSSDPQIAAKAKAAIVALTPAAPYPRGSAFAYVINDSRFADTFYGADVRYNLTDNRVTPYVILHLSSDTRSGAVGASDIYNYDAIAANVGISAALGPHATAFVEGGQSIGLRGQTNLPEMRYGLTYYQEFGALGTGHTTIGASAAHYSQFAGNDIAYATLTHDFPLAGRLRGVVGANAALDAQRAYYNNYGELFGGLQFGTKPLAFRLIHVYGSYLSRGIAVPAASGYQTTRLEALYGVSFK